MTDPAPLTEWLRAAGAGDDAAGNRAYAQVYAELRRLAARQLANASSATLTPTALVNEAFLKLAAGSLVNLNDRRHFFNLAARAMRQTVIDYARERLAENVRLCSSATACRAMATARSPTTRWSRRTDAACAARRRHNRRRSGDSAALSA